ncbi:MAG: DUF3800 domain-containing protein [Clostridia bacterium]|nr:DUF3800 domain-containing protein [Clostridia bacterium]
METYIAYFDETGDDGIIETSSDTFVLTSLYMSSQAWQSNFDSIKECRKQLKETFGFHTSEEMHTKHFLTDKGLYRPYGWSAEQRREILKLYTKSISRLSASSVNVVIDKTRITHPETYQVLQNALTYNIQRIENDSKQNWNYLIITDPGRLPPMRKTAREIRAFNPIPSQYGTGYRNQPIKSLIEDILEKDSKESYFIQICDFISYFVHLYYKTVHQQKDLPNRVGRVIDKSFVGSVMATLREGGLLNLDASQNDRYGLVIYPK